jgi:hypothetical protein
VFVAVLALGGLVSMSLVGLPLSAKLSGQEVMGRDTAQPPDVENTDGEHAPRT